MSDEEPADEAKENDEALDDGWWGAYSSRIIASLSAVLVGTGTVVYHTLEDWSWLDSLYFTIVTLTTVGYGDLTPSSAASKTFTMLYIVSGISLLAAMLNEVMKRSAQRASARRRKRKT
jgi:hypothetical protein